MELYIWQKPNELTFILKKGKKAIKRETYTPEEELSKEFLELLDKFLKNVRIEITDIKSFKLRQSKDVGFTARRVVKATVNSLNLKLDI